jgi:hypothetical protein
VPNNRPKHIVVPFKGVIHAQFQYKSARRQWRLRVSVPITVFVAIATAISILMGVHVL